MITPGRGRSSYFVIQKSISVVIGCTCVNLSSSLLSSLFALQHNQCNDKGFISWELGVYYES